MSKKIVQTAGKQRKKTKNRKKLSKKVVQKVKNSENLEKKQRVSLKNDGNMGKNWQSIPKDKVNVGKSKQRMSQNVQKSAQNVKNIQKIEQNESKNIDMSADVSRVAAEIWSSAGERKAPRRPKVHQNWVVRVNRRWPWLKAVLAVALVTGVIGGVMTTRILIEQGRKGGATEVMVIQECTDGREKCGEDCDGDVEKCGGRMEQCETEDGGCDLEQNEVNAGVEDTEMEQISAVTSTEGKMLVALTFDDGPGAETTGRLLDVLREKGVRATFFVLGTRAQANPDLVKREIGEGHEVGTHSMRHANLSKMGWEEVRADIDEAMGVMWNIAGVEPTLFRPPYGAISEAVKGMGMPLVLWTVDPNDWKDQDKDTVQWRVVNYAFDGAIILMHDIYKTTVEAVGGIIDDLRGKGYELVTVSQLAAARGVEMVGGGEYGSFRP